MSAPLPLHLVPDAYPYNDSHPLTALPHSYSDTGKHNANLHIVYTYHAFQESRWHLTSFPHQYLPSNLLSLSLPPVPAFVPIPQKLISITSQPDKLHSTFYKSPSYRYLLLSTIAMNLSAIAYYVCYN